MDDTRLPRLSERSLAKLPGSVARPNYDRNAVRTGIVHLGLGAFHRAHMAVHVDDLLRNGETGWGIEGVSLRSLDTADALGPQDGLYTVLERGERDRFRVVGSLLRATGPDRIASLLEGALVSDALRVVSLTITEKAYGRDGRTGGLDESAPAIGADLASPRTPRTAVGLVVETLRRRIVARLPPITVLSCDNLASNGRVLERLVVEFARLALPAGEARAVAEAASFPSTMVDRIVPATTDDDRRLVGETLGTDDRWPVIAEPFSQWVIEDRFAAGPRPRFEDTGAALVRDVAPFEAMKLRMLNGSHTALALLGRLVGHATVHEAIDDPDLLGFVRTLMSDSAETLPADAGLDPPRYAEALLDRFRNGRLPHRLEQIASDTSQKLGPRILSVIRDRRVRSLAVDRHALVLACWLRALAGADETGREMAASDPAAGGLADRARNPDPMEAVRSVLGEAPLFGDAGQDEALQREVAAKLDMVRRRGVRAAISETVAAKA